MTDTAGIRSEILFNPATSKLLAESNVQAAPQHVPRCAMAFPVGTVINSSVYLETGIVNSITDIPGGGRIPFRPPGGAAGAAPSVR
jgi:hypothetical protein